MELIIRELSYWKNPVLPSKFNFLVPKDDGILLCKILLDKISLRITPGSVTAIHGYGAGCSALISILSLQHVGTGHVTGSVLYDQSIRSPGAYCDIATCSKLPLNAFFDLTVFDYLFWAARLRVNASDIECGYANNILFCCRYVNFSYL